MTHSGDGPAAPPEPATVDLDLVLAEIHAEADRLRRSHGGDALEAELDAAFRRHTPPDLDAADSAEAFAQLDALASVSIPAPDSAPRPGRAEWKRTILRGIGVVLRSNPVSRLLRMATSEITAFNAAVVRVLRRVDTRLGSLESRVGEPSPAAAQAVAHAEVPAPSAALVDGVAATLGAVPGRVLHVGCGRGELVRALTAAGVSAYGIDSRRALHVDALRDGLDVRGEPATAHLRSLPDRSVGAVVIDALVDRLGVNEQIALLDDAVRAVARGGRIVVVLSERTGAAAVAADLSGGRALLPATWEHLLAMRAALVRRADVDDVDVVVGDLGG